MNLNDFIAIDWPPNAWIEEKHMRIYVRRSMRLLKEGKEMIPCLDVASVEVDEDQRGKGLFTAFLHRFEEEAKKQKRYVYVESILEIRLEQFLLKREYAYAPGISSIAPSMFKNPT